MVSLFGFKFGGDKKKKRQTVAGQTAAKPPQEWKRIDQNTLGEGQFFGRNVHQKGVINGSARPQDSGAASIRTDKTGRRSLYNMGETHTLAAASMYDLSSSITDFKRMTMSSERVNGAIQSGLLKPYASEVNMRARIDPDSWITSSPDGPVGLPPRPDSATSNRSSKAWINPLDVHFNRPMSRTFPAPPVPPLPRIHSSPLAATSTIAKSPLSCGSSQESMSGDLGDFAQAGDQDGPVLRTKGYQAASNPSFVKSQSSQASSSNSWPNDIVSQERQGAAKVALHPSAGQWPRRANNLLPTTHNGSSVCASTDARAGSMSNCSPERHWVEQQQSRPTSSPTKARAPPRAPSIPGTRPGLGATNTASPLPQTSPSDNLPLESHASQLPPRTRKASPLRDQEGVASFGDRRLPFQNASNSASELTTSTPEYMSSRYGLPSPPLSIELQSPSSESGHEHRPPIIQDVQAAYRTSYSAAVPRPHRHSLVTKVEDVQEPSRTIVSTLSSQPLSLSDSYEFFEGALPGIGGKHESPSSDSFSDLEAVDFPLPPRDVQIVKSSSQSPSPRTGFESMPSTASSLYSPSFPTERSGRRPLTPLGPLPSPKQTLGVEVGLDGRPVLPSSSSSNLTAPWLRPNLMTAPSALSPFSSTASPLTPATTVSSASFASSTAMCPPQPKSCKDKRANVPPPINIAATKYADEMYAPRSLTVSGSGGDRDGDPNRADGTTQKDAVSPRASCGPMASPLAMHPVTSDYFSGPPSSPPPPPPCGPVSPPRRSSSKYAPEYSLYLDDEGHVMDDDEAMGRKGDVMSTSTASTAPAALTVDHKSEPSYSGDRWSFLAATQVLRQQGEANRLARIDDDHDSWY